MSIFDRNVCTFIPNNPHQGNLQIIHLVYETKPQIFDGWKTHHFFRMHFVTDGKGVLHTQYGTHTLNKGDIFFCLPSCPYAIQSIENFKYIYIGYLGERSIATADKFNLTIKNCVFKSFEKLSDLWINALRVPTELSDVYCEGLFLCSFAEIMSTISPINKANKKQFNTPELIKKYVDDNFSDSSLSLESISLALSYTPKHISKIFKSAYKISFKEYVNTIRINNAFYLMNNGFSSVKEIAFLCGFNDSLYFSKVFKAQTKQSPSEYLAELKKQNK